MLTVSLHGEAVSAGRLASLGACLRKEVREQWLVLLGVPVACLLFAIMTRLNIEPESMSWLPTILAAVATCATALAFGSDLFAGDVRRGSGEFLARTPRAVDGTLLAKFLLFFGAVPAQGVFAWGIARWAIGLQLGDAVVRGAAEMHGVGLEQIELPWLAAIGFASWLAAMACLVRQPGLALLAAIAPFAVTWLGALYGLQGVHLESRYLVTAWWWLPWCFGLAPCCLALVYRWRTGRERCRLAWVPALAIVAVPSVGVAGFVSDWRHLDASDAARVAGVFVAKDGRHAFVNFSIENEHGSAGYAGLVDLEDGSLKQLGGPGECVLPSMVFALRYRGVRHEYVCSGGSDEVWYGQDGQRIQRPDRGTIRRAEFAVVPKFTAVAQRLRWTGGNRLVETLEDGGHKEWFSGAEGSRFCSAVVSPHEPFQLTVGEREYGLRFDLFRGERIQDDPSGYSGRTVVLEEGQVFVPFRRRYDPDLAVSFSASHGGGRADLALDDGQTVGWVLDEHRVVVVSEALHNASNLGAVPDTLGWIDPATGERGAFSWVEPGCRNLVLQLCRGRTARELLLVVVRDDGLHRAELVWDDGPTVGRVPIDTAVTINSWDGGDSAIVSDRHRIYRIWRDGRADVLFSIGIKP